MKIRRLVQAASIIGVAAFIMAVSASASTVRHDTNEPRTGFGGSSVPLNNSLAVAATLAAILSLIGAALLGLGIMNGKRSSRQLGRVPSGADEPRGSRQFKKRLDRSIPTRSA
jgi:hypothetical protein